MQSEPVEPLPAPPCFLYRSFEILLPGGGQHMDSMEGFLPNPSRPVCASAAPVHEITPEAHVLHGFHTRSCWLSATTGLAEALAFAMFAHAKEGVTPFSPKRCKTEPPPARRSRDSNPEPIIQIETSLIVPARGHDSVRFVRLDSEHAATAASLRAERARRNAIEVREVLFDGSVHADAVRAIYAVNLRRGMCARLPRFKKDWMEIVHPSCFSDYLEMLYREYSSDGAQWVPAPCAPGHSLELPAQLVAELLSNGQALVEAFEQPLRYGDRVEAHYGVGDDELWYPGTVDCVRQDGRLDVIYDDDEFEFAKPCARVRRRPGVWHRGFVE